ncbi:MAG: class I SAM-dependent methyltransferase [Acidimicrobiales bacterium]
MDHDAEVVGHYEDRFDESARLRSGAGLLELLRTQEVIERHVALDSSRIIDIGGGPGVYASWLAGLGHDVVVVDPVPRHVAAAGALTPSRGSIVAGLGDARSLDFRDDSFDAAVMLGPLYHLLDRPDRVRAWAEARRVTRAGGVVVGATISRFASIHDGLSQGWLDDEAFAQIAADDMQSGKHVNPSRRPEWFTSAYFHRPEEIAAEAEEAGMTAVELIGVEGTLGWVSDLDRRLSDPVRRRRILNALGAIESEPSLIGVSAHILAIGNVR